MKGEPPSTPRGDQLERLYRAQGSRMWQAVLAFAGDAEVASDAVAETFAQALHRGNAIRDPERWLWRTVFLVAAGELKARKRSGSMPKEDSYEMEESAQDLLAALGTLPPKQRASVVLHDAAGYSAKEIAAIIGSTTAAVHVHMSRARRRLRQQLEDRDAEG